MFKRIFHIIKFAFYGTLNATNYSKSITERIKALSKHFRDNERAAYNIVAGFYVPKITQALCEQNDDRLKSALEHFRKYRSFMPISIDEEIHVSRKVDDTLRRSLTEIFSVVKEDKTGFFTKLEILYKTVLEDSSIPDDKRSIFTLLSNRALESYKSIIKNDEENKLNEFKGYLKKMANNLEGASANVEKLFKRISDLKKENAGIAIPKIFSDKEINTLTANIQNSYDEFYKNLIAIGFIICREWIEKKKIDEKRDVTPFSLAIININFMEGIYNPMVIIGHILKEQKIPAFYIRNYFCTLIDEFQICTNLVQLQGSMISSRDHYLDYDLKKDNEINFDRTKENYFYPNIRTLLKTNYQTNDSGVPCFTDSRFNDFMAGFCGKLNDAREKLQDSIRTYYEGKNTVSEKIPDEMLSLIKFPEPKEGFVEKDIAAEDLEIIDRMWRRSVNQLQTLYFLNKNEDKQNIESLVHVYDYIDGKIKEAKEGGNVLGFLYNKAISTFSWIVNGDDEVSVKIRSKFENRLKKLVECIRDTSIDLEKLIGKVERETGGSSELEMLKSKMTMLINQDITSKYRDTYLVQSILLCYTILTNVYDRPFIDASSDCKACENALFSLLSIIYLYKPIMICNRMMEKGTVYRKDVDFDDLLKKIANYIQRQINEPNIDIYKEYCSENDSPASIENIREFVKSLKASLFYTFGNLESSYQLDITKLVSIILTSTPVTSRSKPAASKPTPDASEPTTDASGSKSDASEPSPDILKPKLNPEESNPIKNRIILGSLLVLTGIIILCYKLKTRRRSHSK